ncbi:MAG: NAD(+) synthase [Acholeplasmatales bacterium]|jgi:NAD+ synthase (glutamine-hydrolysing)|nr:NAD(+) synthase [Acholeplasmatales bacterium]
MYKNGYLKASLVSPKIKLGDLKYNSDYIINILNNSFSSLVVFPELSITGYSLNDLFFNQDLLNSTTKYLDYIIKNNSFKGLYILGCPLVVNNLLYNCAVVIKNKKILGVVPKTFLPNTHEFYEKRWFSSLSNLTKPFKISLCSQSTYFGNVLFQDVSKNIIIGVEICEDMWAIYPKTSDYALKGANVMINLSASPERVSKHALRINAIKDRSRSQVSAYLYVASDYSESSSEVVFSGVKAFSTCGKLIKEVSPFEDKETLEVDIDIDFINYNKRLESNLRDLNNLPRYKYKVVDISFENSLDYSFSTNISSTPFIPTSKEDIKLIFDILVHALVKKIETLGQYKKLVIGISGGLDSTLALIIASKAFEKLNMSADNIIGVTMPSTITSSNTLKNAIFLIDYFKAKKYVIPIESIVAKHLEDINHETKDVVFENAQARIRTLNLMDLANKEKGIVLGTGDLSEIALGWMTYNGDQQSMYCINSGIPKTVVRELIKNYALSNEGVKDVLETISSQSISPELLDNQDTEKIIGSYNINDFILYHHIFNGSSKERTIWLVEKVFNLTINQSLTYVNRFLNRFYQNQFKRQNLPEGPKVFSFSLSPRGDYRLPSDIEWKG